MIGFDLLTGEKFTKRKSSQRFANRANQIRYNNRKATTRRREVSPYLRVLNRNRTILSRVLGDKKEASVPATFLQGAGFNFSYVTQISRGRQGTTFGVFELRLMPLKNAQYKVFRVRSKPTVADMEEEGVDE